MTNREQKGRTPSPDVDPERMPQHREERRRRDRRKRTARIAVVGDFHCGEEDVGAYRAGFARVNEEADVLLLAGDLTRRGTPAEMRVVIGELADVDIPIVAVLGNHDHESGQLEEAVPVLRERGIHVLDGDTYVLSDEVGIVGVKGFMGGFGRGTLTPFGEADTKVFVKAVMDEAAKLELGLRRLHTPVRVVLLHYAPVVDTILGEPEQIFAFLGTDRLAEPIDRFDATVVFHGHAHHGSFRGATPGGVPVFNVSLHQLQEQGIETPYFIYEIPIPEAAEDEEETAGVEAEAARG